MTPRKSSLLSSMLGAKEVDTNKGEHVFLHPSILRRSRKSNKSAPSLPYEDSHYIDDEVMPVMMVQSSTLEEQLAVLTKTLEKLVKYNQRQEVQLKELSNKVDQVEMSSELKASGEPSCQESDSSVGSPKLEYNDEEDEDEATSCVGLLCMNPHVARMIVEGRIAPWVWLAFALGSPTSRMTAEGRVGGLPWPAFGMNPSNSKNDGRK
ncbi:hypothetical protein RHGRI_010611 [Rhododendron griersonianum]|uniref:Uncharacterized protein n=1 Tax=Rhododendron griersonianum TaxID=479676 RepID=A0AAV6KJB1_9ERIC|nr:hypothetical protein RHGRI_010611 [Rhododendron griersonianum]